MNKKILLLSIFAFLPLTACNNPKPAPTVEKVKANISCIGHARVNGITNINEEIDKDSDFTCTFSIAEDTGSGNFVLPEKGDSINFLVLRDNQPTDDFTYDLKESKKEATFKIKASADIKIELNNFLTATTFYCENKKTHNNIKIGFVCNVEDTQAAVIWGDGSIDTLTRGTRVLCEHTYNVRTIAERYFIVFTGKITQIFVDTKAEYTGNDYIESIDFSSHITHISAAHKYAQLINLVSIYAPGASDIEDNAFKDNKSLQSCSLFSPIYIGNSAFNGCGAFNLLDLSETKSIPSLGSNVFDGCKESFKIRVPANLIDEFKANEHWKPYSDHMETPL